MASSDPKPGDKAASTKPAEEKAQQQQQNSAGSLEEDDEFEDFPVEGALFCAFILPFPPFFSGLPPPGGMKRKFDRTQPCLPTTVETDWPEEETEAAAGDGATQHLWEESWDDDDTSDDFSAQLR